LRAIGLGIRVNVSSLMRVLSNAESRLS